MARKSPLRKQPTQERSQHRIERILDAADGLFGQVGYEEATTNAIAARADTSIGSLYQFFGDKEAILEALAARYRERLHAIHERVLNPETAGLPLDVLYDRVIGALSEFHQNNPGFRLLFHGSPTSAGLAQAAQVLHQECISRVEHMLAVRVPSHDPDRRRLVATINVEVMKALLPVAESGNANYRAEVLGAIKQILMSYTADSLGQGLRTDSTT